MAASSGDGDGDGATTDDVIIVGGSFAGMSAALQLARARRRVRVIDARERRNRFAARAHGFLGQDGRDPAAIVADARAALRAHPTLTWVEDTATAARAVDGGFEVELGGGARCRAAHVVLATGVVDEVPAIDGLPERWGAGVYHCPYCHGYELGGGAIAVIASGPGVEHLARLLPDWGPTTLFVEDVELDPITRTAIAARGVTFEEARVAALEGDGRGVDVRLHDGRVLPFAGVFVTSVTRLADDLGAQLGCAVVAGPHPYLEVNGAGETTVRGVYACGDAATASGSIATAVGDGARVGVAVHQSLVFR